MSICIFNKNQVRSVKAFLKNGLFATIFLLQASAKAQVVNNGGSIKIEAGGQLKCSGSVTNTTGAIDNDGRIEVQGSFINSGTYVSAANRDSLVMFGSGNAVLNSGGAGFHYLTINKTLSTDVVTLGGSVLVKTKLNYLSGILSTDYANHPSYVVGAPASAEFNIVPGNDIVGTVKRTGWMNGSSVIFNSSQMQITTSGGTAPTDVSVTMLPEAFGGDPSQNEREVKRKFLLAQNGGNNFTADVRFPYSTTELSNNTEANLAPWFLNAAEWNAYVTLTRDAVNKSVVAANIPSASFAQEWKLADPRYTFHVTAFLRGSWNGSSMNAGLNGFLPLSQPYNAAPFNYAGTENVATIPSANIVDWILVELRKAPTTLPSDATAATIIGRKAGLLLKDGTIVEPDGTTPLQFDISKQGNAFLVVRHRNHLAVMSNLIPSNSAGTFSNDFSLAANVYANGNIVNAPLQVLPGSAKYGLWAGDANRDGVINASDIGLIKSQANGAQSGYLNGDVNFDGNINASDVGLSKLSANAAASSHSSRAMSMNNTKTISHTPAN